MDSFTISCHCEKVSCLFSTPITTVVQCHCNNCRKLQGGDFATWVAVPDNQFSIEMGSDNISNYAFNDRSSKCFCSSCGTVIFGINGKHFSKHKLVSLGTVKNYSEILKPQIQVYTENKAEWSIIQEWVPKLTSD